MDSDLSYDNILITGPISVRPTDIQSIDMDQSFCVVIMGPTGSGKSSVSRAPFHDDILVRLRSASNLYQFLESLASKQTAGPLGIAKDQLESVTHSVTCYELVNVLRNRSKPRPLIIIDTPGLADPKISEIQVLKNIKQWREKCADGLLCQRSSWSRRVLYMHPITDRHIPGSKRKCLAMIKDFWGARQAPRTLLVTSMWDRLKEDPETRRKAEQRLRAIGEDQWGDWVEKQSKILKFENTFDSAMNVLSEICGLAVQNEAYPAHEPAELERPLSPSGPVYDALHERVEQLAQRITTFDGELRVPSIAQNSELVLLLTEQRAGAQSQFSKFSQQMSEYFGVHLESRSTGANDHDSVPTPEAQDLSTRDLRASQLLSAPSEKLRSLAARTKKLFHLDR